MNVRRTALLPPYSVFFRFVFTGKKETAVKEACMDFETGFRDVFSDVFDKLLLFDCGEAPVKKIQGHTRWHVLIKVLNDADLAQFRNNFV